MKPKQFSAYSTDGVKIELNRAFISFTSPYNYPNSSPSRHQHFNLSESIFL